MSGFRPDDSEPCAVCGVAFGQHGQHGMAVTISIDRLDDPFHPFALFVAPPVPYVAGGEFQSPKREQWRASEAVEQ